MGSLAQKNGRSLPKQGGHFDFYWGLRTCFAEDPFVFCLNKSSIVDNTLCFNYSGFLQMNKTSFSLSKS